MLFRPAVAHISTGGAGACACLLGLLLLCFCTKAFFIALAINCFWRSLYIFFFFSLLFFLNLACDSVIDISRGSPLMHSGFRPSSQSTRVYSSSLSWFNLRSAHMFIISSWRPPGWEIFCLRVTPACSWESHPPLPHQSINRSWGDEVCLTPSPMVPAIRKVNNFESLGTMYRKCSKGISFCLHLSVQTLIIKEISDKYEILKWVPYEHSLSMSPVPV